LLWYERVQNQRRGARSAVHSITCFMRVHWLAVLVLVSEDRQLAVNAHNMLTAWGRNRRGVRGEMAPQKISKTPIIGPHNHDLDP